MEEELAATALTRHRTTEAGTTGYGKRWRRNHLSQRGKRLVDQSDQSAEKVLKDGRKKVICF